MFRNLSLAHKLSAIGVITAGMSLAMACAVLLLLDISESAASRSTNGQRRECGRISSTAILTSTIPKGGEFCRRCASIQRGHRGDSVSRWPYPGAVRPRREPPWTVMVDAASCNARSRGTVQRRVVAADTAISLTAKPLAPVT